MNEAFVSAADLSNKTIPKTQLLVFTLAGCEISVDIGRVREIIRYPEMTTMPKAPRYMEGIMNLRGRIFPVLDLKRRFDMPLVDRTPESRVVVIEEQNLLLGLLVDRVLEVLGALPAEIERISKPFMTIGAAFVEGFVTSQGRLIVLLDLNEIFRSVELKTFGEQETASRGEREP
ncbi:MAG TPA: chemotaxis protein CheW [bacterium]|nr:chemotaxis protein CheW [bacterium]